MNFDELTRKFKKIGHDTVNEVQKMNEIRQLKGRVNEEKKALNAIYMEMGKKLYEMYKESPLEGFEAEMRSVEERFSMIDLLEDQARAVKGVALCPNCNMEVGAGERFCSNCGGKMPEVFVIEDAEVAEQVEAAEEMAEEVVEADEETAEEAAETAEDAAETVEEVMEAVEEAAETAAEVVKDAAEEIAEAVEEAVESMTETEE